MAGNSKLNRHNNNNDNHRPPLNPVPPAELNRTEPKDGNGVIENEELKGFIKDLMDFLGKVPDTKDIEEFERMVMEGCDANGDGKINKRELTTVLLALVKHAADEQKQKSL